MKPILLTFLLTASLSLCSVARAQDSVLEMPQPTATSEQTPQDAAKSPSSVGLFLDSSVPLSLRIKDLNSNWRQISVGDSDSSTEIEAARATTYNDLPVVNLMEAVLGVRKNTYFTQWQTATTGKDSFLIVYRTAPFGEDDIENLFPENKTVPPSYARFMARIPTWMEARPLDLTLLNLKTVKIVDTARPFNFNSQVEMVRKWAQKNLQVAAPKVAAPKVIPKNAVAQQQADLRELSLSILLYAQDNDDTIPPMKDVLAFKKAVVSYIKSDTLWRPETKPFYTLNPILSGKKTTHISVLKDMVTLYQTQPDKDNSRLVAFLDGSVRRLDATQWLKYKRGSKIK